MHLDVINQRFVQDDYSKCKIIASAKSNNLNDFLKLGENLLIPKVELHNCKICKQSFGTKSNLNKHTTAVHELKKPLDCKICGANFKRNDRLNEHISVVHEKKKPYQCSGCGYQCSLKMNMSKHLQSVHTNENCKLIYLGEKDHKCTFCDFSSALKADLTKHVREAHAFGKSNRLKMDVESVHESKKQQIEQSPIINRKEETKANNNSVQDFSSDEFNEDFSSDDFNENFSSDEFNEEVDPLEVNHEASVHEESSKKNTQNEPCTPVLFGGINNVKPIELTNICRKINFPSVHEERKPYICYFCNASFLSKEHVKQHISIVHEGK